MVSLLGRKDTNGGWYPGFCDRGRSSYYPTHPPPPKTNMTMENPPFEDVFPIENGGFSIAMLAYWRVCGSDVCLNVNSTILLPHWSWDKMPYLMLSHWISLVLLALDFGERTWKKSSSIFFPRSFLGCQTIDIQSPKKLSTGLKKQKR